MLEKKKRKNVHTVIYIKLRLNEENCRNKNIKNPFGIFLFVPVLDWLIYSESIHIESTADSNSLKPLLVKVS